MFDNISIEFAFLHEPFGNIKKHLNVQTKKKRVIRKHIKVEGAGPYCALRVWSLAKGKRIRISGSFAKFLQGHNAFGGNDLELLCRQTIKKVLRQLGCSIRPSLSKSIRQALLQRVDFAGGYKLKLNREVSSAIRAIKLAHLDSPREIRFFGNETVYTSRTRRTINVLFYDKQRKWESTERQIEAISDPKIRSGVQRYVSAMLRFEVRLWRNKLVSEGLGTVSAWEDVDVGCLLGEWLNTVKFKGAMTYWDFDEVRQKLSPAMFRTFALWSSGTVNAKDTAPRTWTRFKSACKEIGVNVDLPPANMKVVKKLDHVLKAQNLRHKYPKWAREMNCVAGLPDFAYA